jgi:hypothetical protein
VTTRASGSDQPRSLLGGGGEEPVRARHMPETASFFSLYIGLIPFGLQEHRVSLSARYGLGGGKDGTVGERLVEGGGGHGARDGVFHATLLPCASHPLTHFFAADEEVASSGPVVPSAVPKVSIVDDVPNVAERFAVGAFQCIASQPCFLLSSHTLFNSLQRPRSSGQADKGLALLIDVRIHLGCFGPSFGFSCIWRPPHVTAKADSIRKRRTCPECGCVCFLGWCFT